MPSRNFNTGQVSDAAIQMFTNQSALAFPPVLGNVAYVTSHWFKNGVVPQLDLDVWADATCVLTNATLYAIKLKPGVIADDDVDTVVHASNQLTITGHAYKTGEGPLRATTSGTLPTGIALATDYWLRVIDANTVEIYSSLTGALDGTDPVEFSDVGSGTHTLVDTAETRITHWAALGLLGPGQFGTVDMTAVKMYSVRVDHSPNHVGYAIAATVSAGNVDAEVHPVYGE